MPALSHRAQPLEGCGSKLPFSACLCDQKVMPAGHEQVETSKFNRKRHVLKIAQIQKKATVTTLLSHACGHSKLTPTIARFAAIKSHKQHWPKRDTDSLEGTGYMKGTGAKVKPCYISAEMSRDASPSSTSS